MSFAAVSARARTMAADLLENLPGAYCTVMERRHPEWSLADAGTDIVIEGYQSCGNTFARDAMEHSNPGVQIASHCHSWTHVHRGLRLDKPVVVLLRTPLDAVASHLVRMRLADPGRELRRYLRFYQRISPMTPDVILAPFEMTTKRFGDVLALVNLRYGTAFKPFNHHDPAIATAVLDRMELVARTDASMQDPMWRIARPSAERAEASRAMRARLQSDPYAPVLERCNAVYGRLLRLAEKACAAP